MSINSTLFTGIRSHLDMYDCRGPKIESFLIQNGDFFSRQKNAIDIIHEIMERHGKGCLLPTLAHLAEVEYGIRELEPWVRDHVVHALLSFALGIYINEKFQPITYKHVDVFQWEVAGLLHDVGYPLQISKDVSKRFAEKINEIKRDIGVSTPDVRIRNVPEGFEKLTNDLNSLDLIQKCLNDWGLRIDATDEYMNMIDSGEICHGIISSLAVLKIIDLLYQRHNHQREYKDIIKMKVNFNQRYFETDVVSACAAIYTHNLPDRCFTCAKISQSEAPAAFLLQLSDCLQVWERPSLENPTGFPATSFNIGIRKNHLFFHADIPEDEKEKMKRRITSTLIAPNIRIL